MFTTTTNNTNAILAAINNYAVDCYLTVNENNAYDAAEYVRDTHYEMWDEEIDIDLDELDNQFSIYAF